MSSILAGRPEALDRAWAQRVVDAAVPGTRVRGVEPLGVDVGTTTRVRLSVDHDGPPDLPRRWFVKLPSRSWRAAAITALPRLGPTECRFYGEVAGGLDVVRPRCLGAASSLGRGYTLVLADVTEAGAVAGRPGDAIDAERAGRVVDLLADLHAARWEHRDLDRSLAWLAGPVRRLEDALGSALGVPLMRRGLDRAGDAVPSALRDPALRWASRRRHVMAELARGPRTLVHHDCHAGNLFWQDGRPGLLDWQLVRIGEGAGDLAYLLGTALEPEARRAAEADLLERYLDGLARRGLGLPDLRARYRVHLTYALEAMVVTLAVGGLMRDEAVLALITRAAQAVADHEAYRALEG